MKNVTQVGLALALALFLFLPLHPGVQAQNFLKWGYKYYPDAQKHAAAVGYGSYKLLIVCNNSKNMTLGLIKEGGGYDEQAALNPQSLEVWVDGQKIKSLFVIGRDMDWLKKGNHFSITTYQDFAKEAFAAVSRFRDAKRNITFLYKSHKVTFPARGSTKILAKLFAKCRLPKLDKKPSLLH